MYHYLLGFRWSLDFSFGQLRFCLVFLDNFKQFLSNVVCTAEWICMSTTINHDFAETFNWPFSASHTIDLFQNRKKNISSLPPLLIATLIATKAFLLEPPTLFSFYRFFLTIGNISSPSFFLESWWQLFFYWIGDFFAAYRKSFFGTQISYMPINVMHIKRLGSDQRHKNSTILLTLSIYHKKYIIWIFAPIIMKWDFLCGFDTLRILPFWAKLHFSH